MVSNAEPLRIHNSLFVGIWAAVLSLVLALILIGTTFIIIFVARRKSKSAEGSQNPEIGPEEKDPRSPKDAPVATDLPVSEVETGPKLNPPPTIEPRLPDHLVLQKDDHLKNKLKELSGKPDILTKEYNVLKQYVHEHIKKEVTVARLPENKIHNRYADNGREITIPH